MAFYLYNIFPYYLTTAQFLGKKVTEHRMYDFIFSTIFVRDLDHSKNNLYPLDRGQGGPQKRSRHVGKDKNLLFLTGIEPRFLGCLTCSLITTPTTVTRLPRGVVQRVILSHLSIIDAVIFTFFRRLFFC